MSLNMTIPRSVVQNISRARSLLKRDETSRALEALLSGLDLYDGPSLMGKARFEAEVLIQECISELNRQPTVRSLLSKLTKSDKVCVAYTPGQEDKLKVILPILYKGLSELEDSKGRDQKNEKENRKAMLRDKGIALLKDGDTPRAKASLRRLGEEFGDEPGVLLDIAQLMLDANLQFEAAEFFDQAILAYPKDSKAYAGATKAYIALREYEKAEEVYLSAIKNFGKHTRTMTNLANLYLAWNKKDLAYDAALDACKLDPTNTEAKEIVDKLA